MVFFILTKIVNINDVAKTVEAMVLASVVAAATLVPTAPVSHGEKKKAKLMGQSLRDSNRKYYFILQL